MRVCERFCESRRLNAAPLCVILARLNRRPAGRRYSTATATVVVAATVATFRTLT